MTTQRNKNLELIERLRGLAYRTLDDHDGQIIADSITALTTKNATIAMLQTDIEGLRRLMAAMTYDPNAAENGTVVHD